MLTAHLFIAVLTAQAPSLPAPPGPAGRSETIHIVQWDGNALLQLVPPVRSEQLPLSDDDVIQLTKNGFEPAQIAKMVTERRCACDASAEGLIRMKKAGVAKEVLAEVSMHGLKPNRTLNLELTFDFVGDGQEAREGNFFLFVDDGDVTRVFTATLFELLSRSSTQRLNDRTDLMLPKTVRRVRISGGVVLKSYGPHTVMAVFSANAALSHPSQLGARERAKAQSYTFNYPRASTQSVCRLSAGFKRDAMLVDAWAFQGSQFDCEWN